MLPGPSLPAAVPGPCRLLLGQLSYFAGHCEDPGCQAVTLHIPLAMAWGLPSWKGVREGAGTLGPAGTDQHFEVLTHPLGQYCNPHKAAADLSEGT